ncbi:MAG TPA: saccharopine dehydrogenase NADP-binding domain-containing protein [Thermoflexales bacterium]|nr:saccharopine dehydrogenase NADP-binding domain-containing protein [Thermoflexales bacterium]
MSPKTILILGGYGSTGRLIAESLLRETDCQLVLAGRTLARAQAAAAELGLRVSARRADAAEPASLDAAMTGADLVVVASSTAPFAATIADAALRAGADYFDLQYSTDKLKVLMPLSDRIAAAGRRFITDGGFHPGLPAVMVRQVAPCFDTLERAVVGSVIQEDWASWDVGIGTMEELLNEFRDYQALEYRDGAWRGMNWLSAWKPVYMDFGPPFGRRACAPMFLEELRDLPALLPGLRETGFYVGGFNWFVDGLVMPLALAGMRVAPNRLLRPLARLMGWGLKRFTRPPFGTLLRVEAAGLSGGQSHTLNMTVGHADGYALTALAAVACLLQLFDGTISRPGLHLQAQAVDPDRMLRDLARMGARVDMHEEVLR